MLIGICGSPQEGETIKAAGADFVEGHIQNHLVPTKPDRDWDQQRRAIEACPLPMPAANCFLPGSIPSTGPDLDIKTICDYADVAFRRAAQVEMNILVYGSGGSRKVPDDFPVDEARDQFIEINRHLGPIAATHGITLVIEPLTRGECNFVCTLDDGAEIVQRVDHPNVRLLADLFHMLNNDESADAIERYGDILVHAHLAEKSTRFAPGTGGDDFRPFFKAFRSVGYDARLAIEAKWQDKSSEMAPAVEAVRRQLADVA
jgi:sugar phosphate isomerase/epimerase